MVHDFLESVGFFYNDVRVYYKNVFAFGFGGSFVVGFGIAKIGFIEDERYVGVFLEGFELFAILGVARIVHDDYLGLEISLLALNIVYVFGNAFALEKVEYDYRDFWIFLHFTSLVKHQGLCHLRRIAS